MVTGADSVRYPHKNTAGVGSITTRSPPRPANGRAKLGSVDTGGEMVAPFFANAVLRTGDDLFADGME